MSHREMNGNQEKPLVMKINDGWNRVQIILILTFYNNKLVVVQMKMRRNF